jgi:hypothetical protein
MTSESDYYYYEVLSLESNKILSVILVVLKHYINVWVCRVVDHRVICFVRIGAILIGRNSHTRLPLCVISDQNFGVIHVAKTLRVWRRIGRTAGIAGVSGEVNTSTIRRG